MNIEEQIKSIRSDTSVIALMTVIIMFQGCLGCNKCDRKPQRETKPTTFKDVSKKLKEIDDKYAFD
jgi:hypothetical protein